MFPFIFKVYGVQSEVRDVIAQKRPLPQTFNHD